MKTISEIKRLLAPLPDDFKRNWCGEGWEPENEDDFLACACSGCANHCGITYDEWRAWLKYDAQWWKKIEYHYYKGRRIGGSETLSLAKRDNGQTLQIAIVRWHGKLPELVMMVDASNREAMLIYDFYEQLLGDYQI